MSPIHRERTANPTLSAKYLAVLGLGFSMGLLILFLTDLRLQWLIYSAVALLGGVFVLAFPAKQRLLTAIFILSLQVDVYVRLLYGHAQSEGLAIPLVVFSGVALFAWYAISGHLRGFKWAGSMGLPILALFATTVISLATTSERFIGLNSLLYAVEFYFLYWLTYNLVQSEEDFRNIIKLLMFVLAIQSTIYFIQSGLGVTFDLVGQTWDEGDVPRPGGTVSTNPAGFASFIMPVLFVAITMTIVKAGVWPRSYAVLLMLLGVAALGLTFTRGAWSGFALGIAVVMLIGVRWGVIQGKMVLLVVVLALVGALMLMPTMLERIAGDYAGEGGTGTSGLDERLGLMRIALNIIGENPVTGIGPGAYAYTFKGYVPSGVDQWLFVVHNEFLLRAAETGIPGALAFVALLVAALRVALRLARTGPTLIGISALGWFGALIALVWQMNWVPWYGWSYNAMLWVMLGLMDGARRLIEPGEHRRNILGV